VVLLTPVVWNFAHQIYATTVRNHPRPDYPHSPFSEYVLKFFLLPLGGEPEPIFPFLAVAFLGDIIGLWLTQKHPLKRKSLNIGISICGGMELVAIGGIIWFVVQGHQDPLQLLEKAWNVTDVNAWLPLFLLLTANQILSVLLMLRIVEFRGKGKEFAQKTKYWRRFGFVPFSVYNYQHLMFVPRYILLWGFGINAIQRGSLNGSLTISVILMTLFLWQLVLIGWEKIHYIGSLEWCMAVLAHTIFQAKTKDQKQQQSPWWKPKKLNPDLYFYHPSWINIHEPKDPQKIHKSDTRLSIGLGLLGLLVFPFPIFALNIARNVPILNKRSKINKIAIGIAIFGIILFMSWFITLSLMSGLQL
jgi:hypothetical protein